MKKRAIRFFSVLMCFAVLVSSLIQPVTVKAADKKNDSWYEDLREWFSEDTADFASGVAGSLAAVKNDDSWFYGMLLGGILNRDVEYYRQPTKIFDKVNSLYKDDLTATNSPNCEYYYQGGDDNSVTSNTSSYQVFQDNSDYSTNNYNYQWYNPITNTYNTTENFYYSNEYNTYYYQQTTNNYQYDYYYIDNSTHVTYYIVETNTETKEENEYLYDVYYELPDGRNSYNLTKEDVWGTYFIYNVDRYESVAEDDGTTLGLWHFDGNTKDSSYWNNSAGVSGNLEYSDGVFEYGKYSSGNTSVMTELYLDKCEFDASAPYTLEWIEYIPDHTQSDYKTTSDILEKESYYNYSSLFLLPKYMRVSGIQHDSFNYCALVYDGTDYSFFVNGIKQEISSYYDADYTCSAVSTVCGFNISNNSICWYPSSFLYKSDIWEYDTLYDKYYYYYSRQHYNTIIDEMRLSKGALYSSNYVPSAEPFTTNSVLVIPEGTENNSILLYSNYDITDYRIGGARPTYPINGSVYIYLEDDIVSSIQQYQVNQWVEVDARVYSDGSTTDLKGYDMSEFKLTNPDDDSGSSGDSSDDGSDSGDDSDNSSDGSGLETLLDGIRDIFNTIGSIVGTILSSLSDFLTSALDALSLFTNFAEGFAGFLSQAFIFIPEEIWKVIGAGLSLVIIAAIILLFKR